MAVNEESRVWGIHTRDDALFLQKSVIAIGWEKVGDLSHVNADRQAFKAHYSKMLPEVPKSKVPGAAGMLYRFVHELQVGDYVVYPSKSNRKINIGMVTGEYMFDPQAVLYAHQHRVKWLKELPRTAFSQGALYEVGSAMSFFSIKNYAEEYLAALGKDFKKTAFSPNGEEDESVAATAEGIVDSTKDYILKALATNLKGYDFEYFVADLLHAMGYRATVSNKGGDSGIDIKAYKDELPPRILIQVKSQDGNIKETTIQSLKGAMREGDYGLFVTISDYTKKAYEYLESVPIIRGINGNDLADLVLKYYGNLSEKHKKLIPLEMVYIPVVAEDEFNQ